MPIRLSTIPRAASVLALVAIGQGSVPQSALAQGVRCSAFLHQRNGSWRSFEPGIILGPAGPVRIATGERFHRGRPSAKDYVARYLDRFCQSE